MKFWRNALLISTILSLSYSVSIMAEDRVPNDVQSFIDNGKYYIIKTYVLPDEQSGEDLAGKSFEQNGIIYNQTSIEKLPLEETETKIAESIEVVNIGSQNSQLALSMVSAQKEYTDAEGFSGMLYPAADRISFSVSGYTTKSYTVKDSQYYYNLPSRDTSNIPKTINSNGINMSITDINFIDSNNSDSGDTAVNGNFTVQAFYSGTYTKRIPSGYSATIPYSGEVSRKIIKNEELKITYEGIKVVLPKNLQTEKQNENHILVRGMLIASVVFGISFIIILVYFVYQKCMAKREE